MKMVIHRHDEAWYIGSNPATCGTPGPDAENDPSSQPSQAARPPFGGLWNGENWHCWNYAGACRFVTEAEAQDYLAQNGQRMKVLLRDLKD